MSLHFPYWHTWSTFWMFIKSKILQHTKFKTYYSFPGVNNIKVSVLLNKSKCEQIDTLMGML